MDRRAGSAALVALLLVLSGCLGAVAGVDRGSPTPGPGTVAEVYEVVDGDTVKIEYPNGTRDTVRLIGIDTPETRAPNDPPEFEGVPDTAAGRECLGTWGDRATEFAVRRLEGRRVRVAGDPNEPARGYYDRLLAYVYVDGESFNYRLVTEGYARVYDSEFAERDRYTDAETAARTGATGLWECATERPPTTTTDEREGVVVAELNADAPGNDNRNLNDEYVVIENRGDEAVDLSGWTVRDEAGNTYAFPDGFVLGPGDRVTVHTGDGEDTATDLYWGRDGAVWNNDGDTAILEDASGRDVDRLSS